MPCRSLAELPKVLQALWREPTPPFTSAYVSLLRSCIVFGHGSLPFVKQLQAHAICHRIPLSGALGDHFVLAFTKCGSLDDALVVSEQLPRLSVLSGTAIVCAYTTSGRPHEALSFFQWMQECRISPSSYTIVALLKACGIIQDLHQGMLFHDSAVAYGFIPNGIVDNTLVSIYGKCGVLLESEFVFHTFPERSLNSWNAMLSAYVELGNTEKALWLYKQMQNENVSVDRPTFVTMLQACSLLAQAPDPYSEKEGTVKKMALEIGYTLHADICLNGFAHSMFINCSLIKMYGKCGAVSEAENVFAALLYHDVVSCGALLSVYAEQELGEMALLLYRQILKEGLSPDNCADCLIIQACRTLSQKEDFVLWKGQELALHIAQALHAKSSKGGSEADQKFFSLLVSLYGSCGAFAEAYVAFSVLSQVDVTSWNSLLYANVACGYGIMALHLFVRMQKDGVCPTQQTFTSALQACALYAESEDTPIFEGHSTEIRALMMGRVLHSDVEMRGFTSDLFTCNAILNVYIKSRAFFDAEVFFSMLPQKNVVSWCTMISGYVDELQAVTALQLYRQMQKEVNCFTELTSVMALQACICLADDRSSHTAMMQSYKTAAFEIGRALHADACRKGFTTGSSLMSILACMYSTCGTMVEAESMFTLLMACKNPPWSTVMSVYIRHSKAEKALLWYMQMQTEGKKADVISMSCAIRSCIILVEEHGACRFSKIPTRVVALEIGRALHSDACRQGLTSDVFVSSAIVSMYGKCGSINELNDVIKLFPKKPIVLWNAILSAYLAQAQAEEVIKLYRQNLKHRVTVDEVTLVVVLQGSSMAGDMNMCMELHFDTDCAGFDQSLPVISCLFHAYGSCASMVDAQVFFDMVMASNIIAWNACIAGHARDGNDVASLTLLEELRFIFGKPCTVSFILILSFCSHVGLVAQGLSYFISMQEDYGYIWEAKHYGSVLDILGRVRGLL